MTGLFEKKMAEETRLPQESDVSQLLRQMALRAMREAQQTLAGDYHSRFAGSGLDFAELTDYEAGEPARFIQWPLSMARGRLLVKRFQEEREMPMILAVDVSKSMRLYKDSFQCLLETVALLGACAIQQQDGVGLLMAAEDFSEWIPAMRGSRQLLKILGALHGVHPPRNGTALPLLLTRAGRLSPKASRIVVISDFLGGGYEQPIRALTRVNDVLLCQLRHRRQEGIPPYAHLTDCETGVETIGAQLADIPEVPGSAQLHAGDYPLEALLRYWKTRGTGGRR